MQGIELFSSVSILVNQQNEEDDSDDETVSSESPTALSDDGDEDSIGEVDEKVPAGITKLLGEHKLDNCNIQVYPPLNPDHEYFKLPNNMMEHLEIKHKETKEGIVIYGKCLVVF